MLKYHYDFTLDEIYNLSMSQYSSYLDNLGYVLGVEEKDDTPKPGNIYNPNRDASDPAIRAEFEAAMGIKR